MRATYKSERMRREWSKGYYVGVIAGWLAGFVPCIVMAHYQGLI